MFVVYKVTAAPPPPFLLSSGLVMSDIVLFSMCEVKSFDILLVPTLESVRKEETGHNNPKKELNVWKIWRLKGQIQIKSLTILS